MLRRIATSIAAATTLILSASLLALASHAEPDATLDGNVNSCADLASVEGFIGDLETHAAWNNSGNNTATPPDVVQHPWWTITFHALEGNPNALLNVELAAGKQIAVLVNGGDATNLFVSEPGESMLGLFAPTLGGNPDEKHSTISHYMICKVEEASFTPPDEETPPPDEETPPDDETTPGDEGGGEPTPTPTSTKTPVPVPTSVPAGVGGSGVDGAAPAALLAAVAAVAVGLTVILRRRGHVPG